MRFLTSKWMSRKLLVTLAILIGPLVLEGWGLVSFGIFLTPSLALVAVVYIITQAWVDTFTDR